MTTEYLTVTQVSKQLQLSLLTIRRYIKAKKLKAYKLGREYRIEIKDFKEFLKSVKNQNN